MSRFAVGERGPELYERYKVPRLFQPMAERLLEQLPLGPGLNVLDIACGTGVVARLAARRVSPSGAVTGIDFNPGMLAVAQARAKELGLEIRWQVADATALPFADAAFDVVCCQQGLQFFVDRRGALREANRVLVPGGVLALAVFGPASRYNASLAEALAEFADAGAAASALAPFALAEPEALSALVAEAGFVAIELRTVTLLRRVEPSQKWLCEDTAGTPFGAALEALHPAVRAALLRMIAARMKDLWNGDAFAVPTAVHILHARKQLSGKRGGAV